MQIYINKNGNQLGPFDEGMVRQMLQNGQLSPKDLAIQRGQHQWQTLEELFPATIPAWIPPKPNVDIPQAQPVQPKSGTSKGLIFGLIGCGGLLLIGGLIGVIALVAISRNRSSGNLVNNNSTNSTNSTNSANKVKTPTVPTDFTALKNKAEEFAKMSPPQKLEANPLIKGKIAIVEKSRDYEAKIIGIDYAGKELYQLDLDKYGFSTARLAHTPEEIDTLIQISCNKGNRLGTYEGGVPAYANTCKTTIIDYKTPSIIAQKTFTNSTPPKEIRTTKTTDEYVLLPPEELNEYLSGLPLEKLAAPLIEMPFDSNNGTYGKYTGFKNLASELVRTFYPEKIDANAAIKGKFAVALLNNTRAELKGFDPFGKEIYKYDYEKWGVGAERLAENVSEIETLIKISCHKGSKLGTVERTVVFSNQCEVSLVDYKNAQVIAKKSFENKEMRRDVDTKIYTSQYVVLYPYSEIDEYIKGFPK